MSGNQSVCQCYSDHGHASSFTKMSATIGSLIFVLLTLLQVKYGNKADPSPFETHPLIMMLFIAAMLTYALAAVVAISFQALVPFLNQICIASGFLASDLLLLILVPVLGYVFLVIWLLLLLLLLLCYVHKILRKCAVCNKVKNFLQKCTKPLLQLLCAGDGSNRLFGFGFGFGASPLVQTSMVQQNGSSEITVNSNEMNV